MTRRIVSYQSIGPGGVVVVGPMGNIRIVTFDDGHMMIDQAINCDFVGTVSGMSDAHKALVDERWGDRTETGRIVDPSSSAKISFPDALKTALTGPTTELPPVKRDQAPAPAPVPLPPEVRKENARRKRRWWRFFT